jgi:hypothetical protein
VKYHITADNKFECSLDYSLRGTTKSFKEEVADHFKRIVEDHDQVYLLFSGGMDSRFIALILLELGIDFTAITYAFSPNFDDYDSRASKDFSKRHGFKHELFNLELEEVRSCIEYHYEKGLSFPGLNFYYILSTLRRYNQPNSVFLTGAASEFLIQNKKITKGWLIAALQTAYPNIRNFTTDRILFSYLDEPIIKDNWQDLSLGRFYLRNKVYGSIYPDKLKSLKKRGPDHQHMVDFFEVVKEKYNEEKFLKRVIIGNFTLDLEEYYNKGIPNGN